MPTPVLPSVTISPEEQATLSAWVRRPRTAQALAMRARIILACERGGTNTEVAAALGLFRQTVGKWRRRFLQDRLDGLLDEPRPGAPRP